MASTIQGITFTYPYWERDEKNLEKARQKKDDFLLKLIFEIMKDLQSGWDGTRGPYWEESPLTALGAQAFTYDGYEDDFDQIPALYISTRCHERLQTWLAKMTKKQQQHEAIGQMEEARLHKYYFSHQLNTDDKMDGEICCICLDGKGSYSCAPCGHRIACEDCALQFLTSPHGKQCPLCRSSDTALDPITLY